MTSLRLALTMLLDQKYRTLLSVMGVLVAAGLIFLQLGFIGSLYLTATQFYDAFDFELVVISRDYFHFNAPGSFDERRLAAARTDPDVEQAMPLELNTVNWHTPGAANENLSRYILMLGIDALDVPTLFATAGKRVFRATDGTERASELLYRPMTVLIDRKSKVPYLPGGVVPKTVKGYDEGQRIKVTTLTNQPDELYLAGSFDIGTGFAANAVLLTSRDTLGKLYGSSGKINLGLLRLKRGSDAATVMRRLQEQLPEDVLVMTREGISKHESRHWVANVPIGTFFQVGVVVAFFVGILFVYQMMSGDVRKHEPQYATLKALGYTNAYLGKVVLWQGLFLGLLGFGCSYIVSLALFGFIEGQMAVPVRMAPWLVVGTFVPTMVMCLLSGFLAVLKVYQMDPADRF